MTNSLDSFKGMFAKELFEMTKKEAHEKNVCINCKRKMAMSLLSDIDYKEYQISGLCPRCFPQDN